MLENHTETNKTIRQVFLIEFLCEGKCGGSVSVAVAIRKLEDRR